MTGLIVVAIAVIATVAFGVFRKLTDGRARAVPTDGEPRLSPGQLGEQLGREATLLQFSSPACAPCRATQRILSTLSTERPELAHVELDAATRLDLVEQFGISRTPTVLILNARGEVRQKLVGAPHRQQVLEALAGTA